MADQNLHYSANPKVQSAISADPRLQTILSQITPGSPEDDVLNGLVSNPAYSGQPFSANDITDAFNTYNAKLAPGFAQAKLNATGNLQADIGNKGAQYQNFLAGQANKFGIDKQNLDSAAASTNGVLAGSARVQKQNNLANVYNLAAASQLSQTQSDIAKEANDYAYQYGSDAANAPGLSNMYKLGSNTYDANKGTVNDTGGVTAYNPSSYNYTGTQPAAQKAAAVVGASGLLANKFNKSLGAFGQGTHL